MSGVRDITELSTGETDTGFVSARIKTDCEDVYQLSRAVFFAFAASGTALLEMFVKKANLEEVFIELTEAAGTEPPSPDNGEPPVAEAADEIVESEMIDE